MKKAEKSWKKMVALILILTFTLTGCGASAPETTDTIQWFNNTYSVLTVLNNRDYTIYSGGPADTKNKILAKALLENTWSVTDRESADETFLWLLEEGHRIPLWEDLEILAEFGLADVPSEQRAETIYETFDLDEEQAQLYAQWFSLYEQYDTDSASGWDYSRAMWLLSYYYVSGNTEAL